MVASGRLIGASMIERAETAAESYAALAASCRGAGDPFSRRPPVTIKGPIEIEGWRGSRETGVRDNDVADETRGNRDGSVP